MIALPPIQAFGWSKLTAQSAIEHRLDASGALLLRMGDLEPPFMVARARDGKGGFGDVELARLGFTWQRVGDGWALRSPRHAADLKRAVQFYGSLALREAAAAQIDPRAVLVTMVCESGAPAPDAHGWVKKPRTEQGYPNRAGENDAGDFERDLEDWTKTGGLKSSHGLMQTLIGTAVSVRPDVFQGWEPKLYRTALWIPENSIKCGVGAMASLARKVPRVRVDPHALRIAYGAGLGGLAPHANRWGVRVFDDLVPMHFVGVWNELACLTAGTCGELPSPAVPSSEPPAAVLAQPKSAWLAVGLASFALAATSAVALATHARRSS
jgi:hypothetical protein